MAGRDRSTDRSVYIVVAAISPLALYPSVVIPLFAPRGDDSAYFVQEIGADWLVRGFNEVALTAGQIPIPIRNVVFASWIGRPACIGYATTSAEVDLYTDEGSFRERMAGMIASGSFLESPIAGLEASRFLGDDVAEGMFAEMVGRRIARQNAKVARQWARNAPLSDAARLIALRSVEQSEVEQSASVEAPVVVVQSGAFAARHQLELESTDAKIITGFRGVESARIGFEEVDVLFLDYEDIDHGRESRGAINLLRGKYGAAIRNADTKVYLCLPDDAVHYGRSPFAEMGIQVVPTTDPGSLRLLVLTAIERLVRERRGSS